LTYSTAWARGESRQSPERGKEGQKEKKRGGQRKNHNIGTKTKEPYCRNLEPMVNMAKKGTEGG